MYKKLLLLLLLLLLPFASCLALVESSMLHTFSARPGECIQGAISLHNEQDCPIEIEIKQADYSCNRFGENQFLPAGSLPLSNAQWITLGTKWLKIPPHSTAEVSYTIRVPKRSDLFGSYGSLILVEPSRPLHLIGTKEQPQITVKIRYAHLLVTTLGMPRPNLQVLDKQVVELAGRRMLAIDVENRGKRFVQPKVRVNLFTRSGQLLLDATTLSQKLLPENSVRYFVDITDLREPAYKGILYISDDKHCFMAEQVDFLSLQSDSLCCSISLAPFPGPR